MCESIRGVVGGAAARGPGDRGRQPPTLKLSSRCEKVIFSKASWGGVPLLERNETLREWVRAKAMNDWKHAAGRRSGLSSTRIFVPPPR